MPQAPETLPEDPAQLKPYALSPQREIHRLSLIIAKLQRRRFGRRSEILDASQLALLALLAETETPETPPADESEPASRKSTKPKRKPLPAQLPRETHRHDIDREQCPCCDGELRFVGDDVSEMLEYIPARFKMIRYSPKWVCPHCQQIFQVPTLERNIPNGVAGPDLLAQVLVSKYCDHLPPHRQSQIDAREGIDLARSTLADWVGQAGALLKPFVEAIRQHTLGGATLHADDTPAPVLDPGRGRTKTGRLWTYVRDEQPWKGSDPPAVWFAYTPDRRGIHPQQHLRGLNGVVHADGFAGFNALDFIRQLYAVEASLRGQPPDERQTRRHHEALPILAALKDWLVGALMQVSQKSELARAIRYPLSRWTALTRYCQDGCVETDNNAAERALRAISLGRKSDLFSGPGQGGERAAALYSLIGTAKLNGLDPMAYLRHVLSVIATHPINQIDDLLPWQLDLPSAPGDICEAA